MPFRLFGGAGFAYRGFRNLHCQLTAVGVTGFLHPRLCEAFSCHPLPRERGEAFGLVGIQNKRLRAAIHLADHVTLEIVQVCDFGCFFLSTRAKAKSKNASSENSKGGEFQ